VIPGDAPQVSLPTVSGWYKGAGRTVAGALLGEATPEDALRPAEATLAGYDQAKATDLLLRNLVVSHKAHHQTPQVYVSTPITGGESLPGVSPIQAGAGQDRPPPHGHGRLSNPGDRSQ